MEKLVKVEGSQHLYKDLNTGVVQNNDRAGYEAYMALRAANEQKRTQILTMEQEVDQLKDDVSEIKNMLKLLLERK
jgi:hypothetical protein